MAKIQRSSVVTFDSGPFDGRQNRQPSMLLPRDPVISTYLTVLTLLSVSVRTSLYRRTVVDWLTEPFTASEPDGPLARASKLSILYPVGSTRSLIDIRVLDLRRLTNQQSNFRAFFSA